MGIPFQSGLCPPMKEAGLSGLIRLVIKRLPVQFWGQVSSVGSQLCLMTSYTPLPCKFSPAEDMIKRYGCEWPFSPSCGCFTGYFPDPIQLETAPAFLHHRTVLWRNNRDCFRVIGRNRKKERKIPAGSGNILSWDWSWHTCSLLQSGERMCTNTD